MPDDKTKRHPQDGKRIDISDPSEIWNWSNSLDVTEKELVDAVEEVGDSADAVKKHLNK